MGFSIFGIGENTPKVKYSAVRNTLLGQRVVSDTLNADEYIKRASKKVNGETLTVFNNLQLNLMGCIGAFANSNKDKEILATYEQESINETMWNKADSNNDGKVDDEELNKLYSQFMTANKPKLLNISLGTSELTSLLGNSSIFGPKYSDEELEQINQYVESDKKLDANHDNVLNREEFNGAAINYFLTPENKTQDQDSRED